MINYPGKEFPLTIAKWDLSWLTGNHPGGPFEDLEKCVREARKREYNAFRTECWPREIFEGKKTFKKTRDPETQLPAWGDVLADHECDILERLSYLADLCRKYDIWLGLDTWMNGSQGGRGRIIEPDEEEKVFTEFSQMWVKAIQRFREEGILERAIWVAPLNEVPHVFVRKVRSIMDVTGKKGDDQTDRADIAAEVNALLKKYNHWMGEAVKEEIEKDNIPLSYSALFCAEDYADRLTDIYDVVDAHYMPDVHQDEEDKAALERAGKGASEFSLFTDLERYDLKIYSQAWDRACRKNYGSMLRRARDSHEAVFDKITLPSGKKFVPIITESFGPCFFPDHPDVSWEWYKRYNGDATRIVASLPFAGATLSNFAEPTFALWDDVEWHRTANIFLLNSVCSQEV